MLIIKLSIYEIRNGGCAEKYLDEVRISMFLLYSVINGVQRHRAFVAMKTIRKTAKLNLRCYTGVPKKKRRVHSFLIYRRIYTPN
jgi:hypothetical protein